MPRGLYWATEAQGQVVWTRGMYLTLLGQSFPCICSLDLRFWWTGGPGVLRRSRGWPNPLLPHGSGRRQNPLVEGTDGSWKGTCQPWKDGECTCPPGPFCFQEPLPWDHPLGCLCTWCVRHSHGVPGVMATESHLLWVFSASSDSSSVLYCCDRCAQYIPFLQFP